MSLNHMWMFELRVKKLVGRDLVDKKIDTTCWIKTKIILLFLVTRIKIYNGSSHNHVTTM